MRLYLAGAISGNPDYRKQFATAAALLTLQGHEVLNPAENEEQPSWRAYMALSLRQLVEQEGIALLPGWESSKGASLEAHVAEALGMVRMYM